MKKQGKKKLIVFLSIFIVILMFVLFFYPLRSYLVMSIYSRYNYKDSVMKQQDFDIDIKGGASTSKKDWYPFVNVYDTTYEFSKYTGRDLSLTVLYNFGAFDGKSSFFYNDDSKYFSAFYGAYVIKDEQSPENRYGFVQDKVNIQEITEVAMFDYKYLVIEDLGCVYPVFETLSYESEYDVNYLDYDDWVKIDAKMLANSPSHARKEHKLGYIQYGVPIDNGKEDFFEIELFGRMYARYFEEYESTIVIYVMGANEDMLEECDKNILSKTQIEDKR